MSLKKYNEKRDFKQTTEPVGEKKSSSGKLIFVVQKHNASHLHYDFRLEINGVLLSWAIPKGPSLNPDDKRLAVLVEEHPYDYKDFEGTIPKGNYGAGAVIVWDNGTYQPTKVQEGEDPQLLLEKQFKKGHMSFELNGHKLKGAFSLVQLKEKGDKSWLLIKKEDEYASEFDILKNDKSVLTDRILDQLETEKKVIHKTEVAFQTPMFATATDTAFDHPDWIYEKKYDGYRTIAVVKNKSVNLFSRNENSFNEDFKALHEELMTLTHEVSLDGEVVIEDEHGKDSFQMLQNYLKDKVGTLKYYVFDMINLDGSDLKEVPLSNRKELLEMLFNKHSFKNIILSPFVKKKGILQLEKAAIDKSEGIIAKHAESSYQSGKRSKDWLKIKLVQQEEVIIVGFTEPAGSRRNFGALLLGQYNGEEIRYIGKCGSGFTDQLLKDIHEKMKPLIICESPLQSAPKIKEKITWVKPELVCQVKFTEWTKNKHLRHPVFLGLRVDKSAEQVMFETEIHKAKLLVIRSLAQNEKVEVENDHSFKVGKTIVHLTNQNKIYFPESKITKGEVIEYYNQVSRLILPYLKDRPQSLYRFPNGIDHQPFYQKNIEVDKVPSWLKTVEINSEENEHAVNYLLCNNKETLLYMANLGCIEINPWNSTINKLNNPDWVIIDIDPELDDFNKVVETALVVKDVMDEVNTPCFCKTSGASGLHVYIPLKAQYDYETVKIFANLIAIEVQSRLPNTTTLERSIKKRNHKIYIDYLQNRKGQTIAAPYCVRPQPEATVSTPLEWDEVNADLSPKMFTIKNAIDRFEKKGDLWKGVLTESANIESIISLMT
ncbi:DNA ligase D [Flavobacterium antarcticum]|uniref:DNA ligase D n=1 Tax=Flavobacterium antarcticum TaxID=271155 RepID=UPI0004108BFA|nr:DNA ligase D [Flavobacterium antarcticum]